MAMMTQAAVERRFLDPASIQLKYRLARRPQAHAVDAGPVSFNFTVSQPTVRLRSRFPRWPMQGLKLVWRLWRAADVLAEHWPELYDALAGFMSAVVNGVHKRIDDVRADLNRLHDDHKQQLRDNPLPATINPRVPTRFVRKYTVTPRGRSPRVPMKL